PTLRRGKLVSKPPRRAPHHQRQQYAQNRGFHVTGLSTVPDARERPATAPFASQEALAPRAREHILRMATDERCFIGASPPRADLIVHLYPRVLRVSPTTVADPDRDYFFLSKGHDVPALYGTLAELGYFDVGRLRNHLQTHDSIYWHP